MNLNISLYEHNIRLYLLGCDSVQSARCSSTFRRNMVPPCSALMLEAELSSVEIYQTTLRHIPEDSFTVTVVRT
jgi:hypothetical protein